MLIVSFNASAGTVKALMRITGFGPLSAIAGDRLKESMIAAKYEVSFRMMTSFWFEID
jgi:hypothetical protein